MRKSLRWVIIGLGYIAPRHIKAIEDMGDDVVAICDTDDSKANMYPAPFYTDYQRMIDDVPCDAVAICTPNHLHKEMALYAGSKGKLVMCEKPLVLYSQDIHSLYSGTGSMLQLRYHPVLEEIEFTSDEPHEVEMNITVARGKDYWKGWKGDKKKSGGILFNLGVHYFDLLILLFGENYEVIKASETDKLARGEIKFGNILVRYELSITEDRSNRSITIDGKTYTLSNHENLSSEDLHTTAYKRFVDGDGIKLYEAGKSIRLIEAIHLCSPKAQS